MAGFDAAAQCCQHRGEGRRHSGRAALDDRPAVPMGDGGEHQRERRSGRPGERVPPMGGVPGEQGRRLVRVPHPSQDGCGQESGGPEPGKRAEMTRHVQERAQHFLRQVVEVLRQRTEQAPPSWSVDPEKPTGLVQRVHHGAGPAVGQRVCEVDLRPAPFEPMVGESEALEERRCQPDRVDGRAVVVHQAGQDPLGRAGTTTDRLGRLQHGHHDAPLRKGDGGGEPVGARPHHDGRGHERHRIRCASARPRSQNSMPGSTWWLPG